MEIHSISKEWFGAVGSVLQGFQTQYWINPKDPRKQKWLQRDFPQGPKICKLRMYSNVHCSKIYNSRDMELGVHW